MGLIQTSEEDYFIEPMAKRTEKQPHLFYKRFSDLASLTQSSTFPRKCTLSRTHLRGKTNALLFFYVVEVTGQRSLPEFFRQAVNPAIYCGSLPDALR